MTATGLLARLLLDAAFASWEEWYSYGRLALADICEETHTAEGDERAAAIRREIPKGIAETFSLLIPEHKHLTHFWLHNILNRSVQCKIDGWNGDAWSLLLHLNLVPDAFWFWSSSSDLGQPFIHGKYRITLESMAVLEPAIAFQASFRQGSYQRVTQGDLYALGGQNGYRQRVLNLFPDVAIPILDGIAVRAPQLLRTEDLTWAAEDRVKRLQARYERGQELLHPAEGAT